MPMGELPIAHGRRSITSGGSGGEISGREGRANERGREEWAKSPSPRLAKGRQRKTVVRVRPRREWRRHDATLAELMLREAEARSETLACISKRENDERERWRESQSVRPSACVRSINREESGSTSYVYDRAHPAGRVAVVPLCVLLYSGERRPLPSSLPPFLPSSLRSTSFVFTFSRRARPSTLSLALPHKLPSRLLPPAMADAPSCARSARPLRECNRQIISIAEERRTP